MKAIYSPSIDKLISNRDYFNSFVYTPLEEAIRELELRKFNPHLRDYVCDNIPAGIPEIFAGKKNAIFARHIATPNFEFRKFLKTADKLAGFNRTILTMHEDKFTPGNNGTKYHLGKIVFNNVQIQNEPRSTMAVDFNKYAGKKISEVKTIWGEYLTDFHSQLLDYSLLNTKHQINQFEGSEWLSRSGGKAKDYYPRFLMLFLQNGILFENFLLKEKGESTFTKDVFLPAFIKIIKDTGRKPLIVSFLPIETEGDNFWNFYPAEYFEFVNGKMENSELFRNMKAA